MSKLEELNAAYAASTQGEWSTYAPCSGQDGFPDNYNIGCDTETRSTYVASVPGAAHYAWSQNNAKFITLAHNMMPDLLKAVELLKDLWHYDFDTVEIPEEGTYERELYDRLRMMLIKLCKPDRIVVPVANRSSSL